MTNQEKMNNMDKIIKSIFCAIIFAFATISGNAQVMYESSPIVSVKWNPNPETNIAGYYINYGEVLGTYPNRITVTTGTKAVLPPLVHGKTYYIVAYAFNTLGLTSDASTPIGVKVLDKNFPTNPTLSGVIVDNRFINILQSLDKGVTWTSIGMIPYPAITGQRYKTSIQSSDPVDGKRYIRAFMSLDAGVTYSFIGKVPYPAITGQSYKSNIFVKK